MKNTRFIIASGGTGGHFYPGFALGKLLNKQGMSVLFVVRTGDPAAQVLQTHKLKYKEVDFMGMPRTFNPLAYIKFMYKLVRALGQTRGIIKAFGPDVCIGTGGYISFPLIFMAHFMGIKTAVHDSNTKIGLANRVCGKFADLFMLGLPTTEKIKNALLTSTPIREEFAEKTNRRKILTDLDLDPTQKTVLVFGGSQGAKGLNAAVIRAVKRIVAENKEVHFIHITGERWYQNIKNQYGRTLQVRVLPYSNEIYDLMQISQFVICRAGASTLAELIYCKKPALLVPFPYAAANHQYYNAKVLQSVGCAQMALEGDNLEQEIYQTLTKVLGGQNSGVLRQMTENYSKLNIPDPMKSAEFIAQTLKQL